MTSPLLLAVSGTRAFRASNATQFLRAWPLLLHLVERYGSDITLLHGACFGIDEFLACQARQLGLHHIVAVVPPERGLVSTAAINASHSVVEIAPGPRGYRRRNQYLVDHSAALLAVPLAAESDPQSRRSGTWQTVRMSRRAGQPVLVRVLSTGATLRYQGAAPEQSPARRLA